jgi:hypothetical protein
VIHRVTSREPPLLILLFLANQHRHRPKKPEVPDNTMATAFSNLQVAAPRRPPVSPSKKRQPSLTLMPTTRKPSQSTSNFNNTSIRNNDFNFSDKNALFQSFSDLCLDDFSDDDEEEEVKQPQKNDFIPQKKDFMSSLADLLDGDEFLDDGAFQEMCTELQSNTVAVSTGSSKEDTDFSNSIASLFASFTDLLTKKRTFDKKECLNLQQEMERLKEMRRRMAMSEECTPDFSGFPEAPQADVAPVQDEQKREIEAVQKRIEKEDEPVTPRSRAKPSCRRFPNNKTPSPQADEAPVQDEQKREIEAVQKRIEREDEPVTPRSRAKPSCRRFPNNKLPSSRRLRESIDDDENIDKSRRSSSRTHREKSDRRLKSSGSKAAECNSPVRSSPSSSTQASPSRVSPRRTVTPMPGEMSSLLLAQRNPSKHGDPLSASSHVKSSRKKGHEVAHCELPMPSSPRRTVNPMPGDMSSLSVSPRKPSKHRDPLSASSHSKSPRKKGHGLSATLHSSSPSKSSRRDSVSLSGASPSTPMKSPRKSRKSDQSDLLSPPVTPRTSRSGGSSPVKSSQTLRKSLQKDPLGLSESSHSLQSHGTPRRSERKPSSGRLGAKPEQSLSSLHHLKKLSDRSSAPDSAKSVSSRPSSRGVRSRTHSQSRRSTRGHSLSRNLKMCSSDEDSVLAPTVCSSEKEDSAPRRPSRRSSQEGQPRSKDRSHSVAPDTEREPRSSRGRSTSVAPDTGSSRRRSNSVKPDTGSSMRRSNNVAPDALRNSSHSHLDIVSRSRNLVRQNSVSSIQSSML